MSSNFNVKSTTAEGAQFDYLTLLHGMKQVTTEPTHILVKSSSCIDLIFSNQPNLTTDFGVHPTLLHSKYHHQIIYSKLNLKLNILQLTLVKLRITLDLRQTQLTVILKVFIGQNFSQAKKFMNQ